MAIARYAGLRLHEVMRIDTAIARRALKNNFITIKGKGGKIRDVPINENIRVIFEKYLKLTPAGHKLFVPKGKKTHVAKTELQNFINTHRKFVTAPDSDREAPITFHGLRHNSDSGGNRRWLGQGQLQGQNRLGVDGLFG